MASGAARRIILLTERSIEQSLKMSTSLNPGVALKMTGPRIGKDEGPEETPGPHAYNTGRQLTEREKVRRCGRSASCVISHKHVSDIDTRLFISFFVFTHQTQNERLSNRYTKKTKIAVSDKLTNDTRVS